MRQFGLIGFSLSHSFSKKYFDEKFVREGVTDAQFENFSLDSIALLNRVMKNKNLLGLAVTIPYKREVIPFLNEVTDAVKQMNACNCIKIREGRLIGYNTDVVGFELSFVKHLQPQHKSALILGTGGAASAVEFVLQKLGILYRVVSRKKEDNEQLLTYDQLDETILKESQIIINCSPLGTYPKVEEAPAIPYDLITPHHYLFDLVYNPAETKFLRLGKEKGAAIQNGYDMLVLQAEANWKIWNT